MSKIIFNISVIAVLICTLSCADYSLKYAPSTNNWEDVALPSDDNTSYTVYLIGDAGNAPMGESTPLFDELDSIFTDASERSTAVWLGDNIYPVGLAPVDPENTEYQLGRHRITSQARTMINYKGQTYFVPGNHDWYTYGQAGLKRQENLLQSYLFENKAFQAQDSSTYFVPNGGCGDPFSVELSNNLVLICLDSHWLLNKRFDTDIERDHCKVKNRGQFLTRMRALFDRYKGRNIVVASHHPVYSYGKHGGYYLMKSWFFPLTQIRSGLYIPLPFSGLIANLARPFISEQDTRQAVYGQYRNDLLTLAREHGRTIITAGHEHTLQFIDRDDVPIIVSGSGSKEAEVSLGEGSEFATGGTGYATLTYLRTGEVYVRFFSNTGVDEVNFTEVYRKRVF